MHRKRAASNALDFAFETATRFYTLRRCIFILLLRLCLFTDKQAYTAHLDTAVFVLYILQKNRLFLNRIRAVIFLIFGLFID